MRLGGYAVGVFEGERLVASKVGSRFVKGRHKKGGSSANRFRRRRDEQERALLDAAAETAARVLEPYRDRIEHVALGGDRAAARRVVERLPWLQREGACSASSPLRIRGSASWTGFRTSSMRPSSAEER